MTHGSSTPRLVTVTIEATIEITDETALTQTALERIDETTFADDAADNQQQREAERSDVQGDPLAAVMWMLDADALVERIPGLQVHTSTQTVGLLDATSPEAEAQTPDFAGLFRLCRCSGDDCAACSGFQLTPRTAAVLWTVTQVLGDQLFDDIKNHGDTPVPDADDWLVLDRYPRITHTQGAVWRRQAARAFDDLTEDLESGTWPHPTCRGEEMALYLVLDDAPSAFADDWADLSKLLAALPEHPNDYDWEECQELLFRDHDIFALFDHALDGVEDPDDKWNQHAGIGDMRPAAWFTTIDRMRPRDSRRPFRR